MTEITDQAGFLGDIYSLHLQSKGHNGKVQPECPFCKMFLLPDPNLTGRPLESYGFIILDASEDPKPTQ